MKKLMNKKGFTLMEMLIVVAIIVILVAISIPTFTSQLDNARTNTDKANLRAAKAVINTMEMTGDWSQVDGYDVTTASEVILYYNLETGEFQTAEITSGYGQSTANSSNVISVGVTKGKITTAIDWQEAPSGS